MTDPIESSGPRARRPASPLMHIAAVRRRSMAITRWVSDGHSPWWEIDRRQLPRAGESVLELTRARFPDLRIPLHSRWRHFEAGDFDRPARLRHALRDSTVSDPLAALRSEIDLCVVSVLLDAGAGAQWQFRDRAGLSHQRSEGLAIASLEAFTGGRFSAHSGAPMQVDASALAALDEGALAHIFQHGHSNRLSALPGRTTLMNRLGHALMRQGLDRPSALYLPPSRSSLPGSATTGASLPLMVDAADLLHRTVTGLAEVWPEAAEAPDGARGDLWPHPAAQDEPGLLQSGSPGWVPFHKLSQWLCYSLVESFQAAGVTVRGLEALTALPEYRNGGLLFDTGVIRLRDPACARATWTPADPLVIEWRAITVTLIDEMAQGIRAALALDASSLPLACVLEGGTWTAGRRLAERLRDGRPPIEVDTGGSVF